MSSFLIPLFFPSLFLIFHPSSTEIQVTIAVVDRMIAAAVGAHPAVTAITETAPHVAVRAPIRHVIDVVADLPLAGVPTTANGVILPKTTPPIVTAPRNASGATMANPATVITGATNPAAAAAAVATTAAVRAPKSLRFLRTCRRWNPWPNTWPWSATALLFSRARLFSFASTC